MPNTAGCFDLESCLRVARLARAATGTDWIKVEVLGDERTLLPDVAATIEAVKILKAEGFIVLPYTTQDPIAARRLYEAGADTVMPLASPIGSGQGLPDFSGLQFIIEELSGKLPIIVDAGIGAPSDAALAMELGADACLINTAIALAQDPVTMARGDGQGREGRAPGVPRRAHPEEALCQRVQPDGRARGKLGQGNREQGTGDEGTGEPLAKIPGTGGPRAADLFVGAKPCFALLHQCFGRSMASPLPDHSRCSVSAAPAVDLPSRTA